MSGATHARGRRALAPGASIAQQASAFWTHRSGGDVTAVERDPQVRGGGYPIDIRGAAAEIIRRMGTFGQIVERRFRQSDSRIPAPSGRHLVTIDVSELDARVNAVDVKQARGDLTRVPHDHTRHDVRYVRQGCTATSCWSGRSSRSRRSCGHAISGARPRPIPLRSDD